MAAMEQVQRLRAYVDANPQDKDALLSLANMNFDIQNWSRAIELYERYLTLDPDNPVVMVDLGASLRSQGEVDRALDLFSRARGLAPDNWQARYNEILVLAFDRGDMAGSMKALEELQRMQPDNEDVNRLAAEVTRRFPG
jgi:tetratricopeptide (TPR) repeat protein